MQALDTGIISELYDTTVSSSKWPSVLDKLHPIVNAKSAGLIVVDKYTHNNAAPHQFGAASASLDADKLDKYNRKFADYERDMVEIANETPVGEIITDPAFLDKESIIKRPDVAYAIEHFGVRDRFGIRLNDDQAWYDAIAFQYDTARGNVTKEEFSRIVPYIPHIALSVSQGRIFDEIRSRYGAVLSMLDRVDIGMVLLSRDGTVLIKNQCSSEIIDRSSKLKLAAGKLVASPPAENIRLSSEIAQVADSHKNLSSDPGRHITLGSDLESDNLLIELSPLFDNQGDVENSFHGVIALMIDPNVSTSLNKSGLKAIYKLTSAELDVAKHIGDGCTNQEVADKRDTSPETTKQHLKSLYLKTKSKSRAGLIRRMISISLPFRD